MNLFKQININQMFDKIQMILMMKTSIPNNRISRLNKYDCLIVYITDSEFRLIQFDGLLF